jgi:hypothetical protein
VDLRVPRLRRLIAGSEMHTWTDALAAGQRAIEEVPSLALVLDLATARITLNGAAVRFTESEFVWVAALVRARKEGVDDGWVRSAAFAGPRAVLRAMRATRAPGSRSPDG